MGMLRAAAASAAPDLNRDAAAPVEQPTFATAPAVDACPDSTLQAAAAIAATAQACPQCATARVPGKRFCRQCRFDFAALHNTAPSIAAARQQTLPEPVEAVCEETRPTAPQAPESELATIGEAPATFAESATPQTHATFENTPVQAAFVASAPDAPIADDAQATEVCPQCATVRTPGKRYCRGCRFDFSAPTQVVEAPVDAVEPLVEVAQAPVVAHATDETRAEAAFVAAPEAARTADSAAAETVSPVIPEPQAEPEPQPEPGIQRETPREADSAMRSEAKQTQDTATAQAARKSGATTAAPSASAAASGGGKKLWIIGGAAVVVVVVGVAVGAGLMLRSHHTPAASDDTAASAPSAASAAPFVKAASEAPSAAPADDAASMPAPSLGAALDAPASDAPAVTGSEANAASTGATIIDTRPQAQASNPAPIEAQPQAQPRAQAEPPAPAPAQTAAPEPAAPAPHVREKPKKSAPSAETSGGENATIRAAIAGNLSDGTSCFSNKKFDCAISNADAVLRLDPHNAQALSLRKRAKAAQQSALNNMSIE
ncbi:hypothetical protein [Burkholderia sp. 8Y]|uniref:hypothetical protein n=1 Tax=Burkholderia sp. 8Y TaxID=2653133 RepID=UPI00135A60C3|nr:hypothetical protein [Burkholderia sp. 8Y]